MIKFLSLIFVIFYSSHSLALCPDSTFSSSSEPPFFVYPITNKKVIIFCGYFDKFENNYTYASEYIAFIMDGTQLLTETEASTLRFGATNNTRIKIVNDTLQIEELVYFASLPDMWIPYPRYTYIFNANTLEFDRHYSLVPPSLSEEKIEKILAKIPTDKSDFPASEYISTELMHAAMNGSKKAAMTFNNLADYFILDGHISETYHIDLQIYNEFLEQQNK